MGADLFESYVAQSWVPWCWAPRSSVWLDLKIPMSLVDNAVLLPLLLAGVGILYFYHGNLFAWVKEGKWKILRTALNTGDIPLSQEDVGSYLFIVRWLLPSSWQLTDSSTNMSHLQQPGRILAGNLWTGCRTKGSIHYRIFRRKTRPVKISAVHNRPGDQYHCKGCSRRHSDHNPGCRHYFTTLPDFMA